MEINSILITTNSPQRGNVCPCVELAGKLTYYQRLMRLPTHVPVILYCLYNPSHTVKLEWAGWNVKYSDKCMNSVSCDSSLVIWRNSLPSRDVWLRRCCYLFSDNRAFYARVSTRLVTHSNIPAASQSQDLFSHPHTHTQCPQGFTFSLWVCILVLKCSECLMCHTARLQFIQ